MNEPPDLDFAALFADIEGTLRLDLSRARLALRHRGLRGGGAEDAFREFLREYLPPSLAICTGEAIDSEGGRTKQLDVIIYDAVKTPTFYRSGGVRVLPIECVYAVIEVKSMLDSSELGKSYANMESVKSLKKKAIIHPSCIAPVLEKEGNIEFYREQFVTGFYLYGKVWEYWPVNYFVFAYDSIDLHTIAKSMVEHRAKLPMGIDMVCSLGKGLIANQLAGGKHQVTPEPNCTLAVDTNGNTLLKFYGLMSQTLSQATLPVFDFGYYLQHATMGPRTDTINKERDSHVAQD